MVMRAADALMAFLKANGIDEMFFLPGGGAMFLNDALAQSGIRPVHCHHEQAAAIAAEAWGRMRNLPGTVMVTTGPGAANSLTPIAGAWIESVPLFVVAGQVKRADMVKDSGVRQKGVQEVDIVAMARPVTKWAKTVTDPQQIIPMAKEAWLAATSGRQGPVLLDVPLDVQGAPWEGSLEDLRMPAAPGARPLPAPQQVMLADYAAKLARAERPLMLVGHGVRLAGMADAVRAFATKWSIPCVFTWNAIDMMPWDDPLNAGRPGIVAPRCSNFTVQNADAFLAVGARMDNVVTAYSPKGFARHAVKAICDIDANELDKLEGAVDYRFESPLADFIAALDRELTAHAKPYRTTWLDWIAQIKKRYPPRDGQTSAARGPIGSPDLAQALDKVLPESTLITTGSSGLCIESFYSNFQNREGQRIFLTSGLGAMGYGLAAAIGATLGRHGAKSALVESDGSLMLNVQELATLKALNLPVCFFLMDNAGYASIRSTQTNYFQRRYVGTGPEAGVAFPDWAQLCAAFGIPYASVSDLSELDGALRAAWAEPGLFVLRVELIADETLWPKCAALPQKDGSMLSMPLEDMSPLLPLEELQANLMHPVSAASQVARASQT
jgi:acetolactate synthase-1/2/3 large subunit